MVVAGQTQLAGDDRDIVLRIVRAAVFAAAPLRDVLGVAVAHDRRPGRIAAAVTCVVGGAAGAVVGKPQVVAEFVRAGLCDVGRGLGQVVVVDQAGE